MTTLDSHLIVRLGGFQLDVELSVKAGQVVALLGPNGAGKTTALRALAGLQPLTAGHVRIGEHTFTDTPPHLRPIGVVFQDYLLFPHLNALDNVAFGPRRRGLSKPDARALAFDWLTRVGLRDLAHHKPRQLSGGQAQRVALARALAVSPALLLLDEPLAALDAGTRIDIRAELHQHLRLHAGATLLVTHDPLDAMMLADHLVVVEEGRIVQQGSAATITAEPQTDYVARLVGLNLYRGLGSGHTVAVAPDFALTVAESVSGEVFVAFAPASVSVHEQRPSGSPRNVWAATVSGIHRHGDYLRLQLEGPIATSADITPSAAAQLGLVLGKKVWVALKATETRAYPASHTANIHA